MELYLGLFMQYIRKLKESGSAFGFKLGSELKIS